jgi:hypothetical protein
MAFTAEQEKAVKDALDAKLKRPACPMCAARKWIFAGEIYHLPIRTSAKVNLGSGQPCVSIVCGNCGHVEMFTVYVLGLGEVLGISETEEQKKRREGRENG